MEEFGGDGSKNEDEETNASNESGAPGARTQDVDCRAGCAGAQPEGHFS